jgi:predicted transcriptional regulator
MSDLNFGQVVALIQKDSGLSATEFAFNVRMSSGYFSLLKGGKIPANLSLYKKIYNFAPDNFKKMLEKVKPAEKVKKVYCRKLKISKPIIETRQKVLEDVVFNIFKIGKSHVLKISEVLDEALMRKPSE